MKLVQSNHKLKAHSGWIKVSCLPVIVGALLLLVPSRINAQINWTKDAHNPIISGGGYGEWNRHVVMPCVLYNDDSSRYEMWFSASTGLDDWHPIRVGACCVGYAVSDDGLNWTVRGTPVLLPDLGAWDQSTIESPTVIRENGE